MAKKTKTNKQYTPAITKRFLLIVDEVIRSGQVDTKGEFAKSVGEHQQNLSLMEKGTRAPTLEHIALSCKLYGYNPTWLILGVGEKKLKTSDGKTIEARVTDLETELAAIKRMVKKK
jgi:hypothetical protein